MPYTWFDLFKSCIKFKDVSIKADNFIIQNYGIQGL